MLALIKQFVTVSSDKGHLLISVAVPMVVAGIMEIRWYDEGLSKVRVEANVLGLDFDIPLIEMDWRDMSKGVKVAGFTMKVAKAATA